MLERTFLHLPGIGARTEMRLWQRGIRSWEQLSRTGRDLPIPGARLPAVLDRAMRSRAALEAGDHRFFAEYVPQKEHWRAFQAFPGRVAYLDIETDGGRDFDSVTVIGLSDGVELRQFIRGENLLDFRDALDDVSLLVTFFGSGFDIPVLREAFPDVRFHQMHLDLCPTLRRLGLRGGLKSIERQLGLSRGTETEGLGGWDAVRLWGEWLRGSRDALKTLLAYNGEDVSNMAPLARFAYRELSERLQAEGVLSGVP